MLEFQWAKSVPAGEGGGMLSYKQIMPVQMKSAYSEKSYVTNKIPFGLRANLHLTVCLKGFTNDRDACRWADLCKL